MPLIARLPYALVFWPVFLWTVAGEWKLYRDARRIGAESLEQDAGTCRAAMRWIELGPPIATAIAFITPFATVGPARELIFAGGIVLLAAGSALRRWCFSLLGDRFTYAVKVRPDQEIVQRGPYRYIRHPSYLGGIAMSAGLGLALTNWLSLALLTVAPIVVYSLRVRAEERALVATLGDPYRAYQRKTKRFIPGLY